MASSPRPPSPPSPTSSAASLVRLRHRLHSSTHTALTPSLLLRAGAYTTTRTHNAGAAVLFWRRHLLRLADSVAILARSNPALLGFSPAFPPTPLPRIGPLADESLRLALPLALPARGDGELAVAVIVTGSNLYLHVGVYSPPVFGVAGGGARLAVVGGGREAAAAKHSEWVR